MQNSRFARRLTGFGLAAVAATLALAPGASADTSAPNWTCRGSAAYIEAPPLLMDTRVEPIAANGVPSVANPDRPLCASADVGAPNITLPPGPPAPPGQIVLQAPFAHTKITPDVAAARDQKIEAAGGALMPVQINAGPNQLNIRADAIESSATGTCTGGKPVFAARSRVVNLSIDGTQIAIPDDGTRPTTIDLSPLAKVVLNGETTTGDATSADQSLTRRALEVQLLGLPGSAPVATLVVGESKVGRHLGVCDPPAPPPPCPAGATRDATGNCVATVTNTVTNTVTVPGPPAACPKGTSTGPTGACLVPVLAPCPAGTTRDRTNGACIRTVGAVKDSSTPSNGSNASRCARLSMYFVPNHRASITNRFGNRLVLRGQLRTCGGKAITGAKLDQVHVLRGSRRLTKTGLKSRGAGKLTLILPLNLRSRTIEISYRPNLNGTRVASRKVLRLTVRDRRGRVLR